MTWHLYLVPVIGSGTRVSPRVPKYISALTGVMPHCVDFGAQPIMLIAADLTNPQETALVANADVTKIPDNLDSTVTAGTLAAVQNALENRNIPGNWITAGISYREVCRVVLSVFFLFQRYGWVAQDYATQLLSGAVNLSSTFSSLPLGIRQNLQTAAEQLDLDTSGFTGASTLRQILKGAADQWANRSRILGGITI